jgi:prophage maintenance system killer protein
MTRPGRAAPIWPGVADLAVVASGALRLGSSAALDLLDIAAAERALAEARSGNDPGDPAADAAALLSALLTHRPFQRGNRRVAVLATLQFLSLNGWLADLDPPEAAGTVITSLAAGQLTAADFAAWLTPRLRRGGEPDTQEAPMRGWIPSRRRTARRDLRAGTSGRLNGRARRAMGLAQDEARRFSHNYVGTEHILLGLLHEGEGVAARALESLGITLGAVRQQVEVIIGPGRQVHPGHLPVTPRVRKVLELSLREAMRLDHLYVATEHILLGLLHEGEGLAVQILARLGARDDQVRDAVSRLLAEPAPDRGETMPPGLRDFEEKIATARREKDAAIEAGDPELAAACREREKQLLAERAKRSAEWTEGVDIAALSEEVGRLRREVSRLQDLLISREKQPGDPGQQTA